MSLADRRVAVWIALLTFATYAWFHAGGGWNQSSFFDLTRAIVERHTFAIDAYAGNTGDLSFSGGHVYANKSPALSWLAVIIYWPLHALERAQGIDFGNVHVVTMNAYVCTLFVVALPAAIVPALLYRLGRRRRFPPGWSAFVALSVAFATQLFPFATIFMIHAPSALLLLLALTSERRPLAGFAAGLGAAMNYLCTVSLLYVALRRRDWKFALGAAPPLAALAVYQYLCFGGLFTSSVAKTTPQFLRSGAPMGVLQWPTAESIWGVTFSPYRGVFYFAPLLLVAFLGFLPWWRDRRLECAGALAAIAALFAFNVSFNGWEAGFSIGGRYLVPLLPLFGIAILYVRRTTPVVTLTALLAAVSLFLNFTAAAVDVQPSGTIPRPVTQYLLPLLFTGHFSPEVPITAPWSAATITGHTSVNRLTYDEPIVFMRHPPYSPASEWTSFNLGEAFTRPGDPRSLLPVVLLLLGGAVAIARLSRQVPQS
jgi:hypothetical protein